VWTQHPRLLCRPQELQVCRRREEADRRQACRFRRLECRGWRGSSGHVARRWGWGLEWCCHRSGCCISKSLLGRIQARNTSEDQEPLLAQTGPSCTTTRRRMGTTSGGLMMKMMNFSCRRPLLVACCFEGKRRRNTGRLSLLSDDGVMCAQTIEYTPSDSHRTRNGTSYSRSHASRPLHRCIPQQSVQAAATPSSSPFLTTASRPFEIRIRAVPKDREVNTGPWQQLPASVGLGVSFGSDSQRVGRVLDMRRGANVIVVTNYFLNGRVNAPKSKIDPRRHFNNYYIQRAARPDYLFSTISRGH